MNTTAIVASLTFGCAALVWLGSRGGFRNTLFVIAAFFVFFAFGPLVNILRGEPVFPGTVLHETDTASAGFALAVAGIVVADAILPQRREFEPPPTTHRIYPPLPFVLLSLAVYGTYVMATNLGELLGAAKKAQYQFVGPFHHDYLSLQTFAVSLFFLSSRSGTKLVRRLWVINLCVFVAYSLLTSERDFIFALFSLLVVKEMIENRKRGGRIAFVSLLSVLCASALFSLRAGQALTITATLNQGSILFVDTFLASRIPHSIPYFLGDTYANTLLGLFPGLVAQTDAQSLSRWLVEMYAPGGTSGYGFSLTGEAYVNFGLAAVAPVFLVLALAHRYVINRADRGEFWSYLSVLSMAAWMYALRGDSTQLLKTLMYGILFYGLIYLTSLRQDSMPRPLKQQPSNPIPLFEGKRCV